MIHRSPAGVLRSAAAAGDQGAAGAGVQSGDWSNHSPKNRHIHAMTMQNYVLFALIELEY